MSLSNVLYEHLLEKCYDNFKHDVTVANTILARFSNLNSGCV